MPSKLAAMVNITGCGRASTRNGSAFEAWTLDSLGNWRSYTDPAAATQTRSDNAANEIGAISGVSWAQPAYDAAGNMTAGPKSGDESTLLHYTYDGWNRLTSVYTDASGSPGTELASYAYDGRGYRIRRTEDPAGTPAVQDFYFNDDWQVLEVRKDGNANPQEQYVWDGRYIDAPAVRFYDANTDGTIDNTVYAINDANFNTTALVDAGTGDVVERYAYTAYGKFSVLDADFSADADGQSDVIWLYLQQGGRHDSISGLDDFRNRPGNAGLGTWENRDPEGVIDGSNLYQGRRGNPIGLTDARGLQAGSPVIDFHLTGPVETLQFHEGKVDLVFPFDVDIKFDPTTASCYEYRQWVRGTVLIDGKPTKDASGLPDDTNWHEDAGLDEFGGLTFYGHRSDPLGNGADDTYTPNRLTGPSFHMHDVPGIRNQPSTNWFSRKTLKVDLVYKGSVVDNRTGKEIVAHFWRVRGKYKETSLNQRIGETFMDPGSGNLMSGTAF